MCVFNTVENELFVFNTDENEQFVGNVTCSPKKKNKTAFVNNSGPKNMIHFKTKKDQEKLEPTLKE